VALICSEDTFSHYAVLLQHLLAGLVDQAVPAALVCPHKARTDSVVPPGVEIIRQPALELPLPVVSSRVVLVDKLSRFRPAVLHCLCQRRAHLARLLSRRMDVPYVLTVNSLLPRWRRFSVLSRRCLRIIASSETIAADIARASPRLAERLERVNIGTFAAERPSCFARPDRLVSMVVPGPLKSADEFEALLGAVNRLAIDGYEFVLAIIGGEKRTGKQLRRQVSQLGLSKTVIMVPRLEPIRSILSACDIFILPEPQDSFSTLLLEAMAAGNAVAGCTGGVDDLIIPNKTAVVFDPDDELTIYAALQKLLNSKEFARKLAASAQQYVRENHSVSRMISSILDIYRSI